MPKVMDWTTYERARELYGRYQNCHRVWETLKEEGYKKTYNTICRWYKQNKEEWHAIANNYNSMSRDNAAKSFQSQRLDELVDLKEKLSKRVKDCLKDKGKKVDSQAIFALKSLIQEVNYLYASLQPKEDNSQVVNIVMDVLLSHHVIGPQLVQFRDEIQKEINRRLKKSK